MTDERDEFRLKNVIGQIRDLEGRGTELVTLFIPPSDNLQDWVGRLSSEYSQASNIKSKRTRTNVQDALKKAKKIVQSYETMPENGLVVYAGRVDDEFIEYSLDSLPHAIDQSNYICDDHFHTAPVEAIVTPDDSYGLVVLTRDKATIGLLVGDRVETVHEFESLVMGKTKAGGQSAQRFKRLREQQKQEHFKDVAESALSAFIEEGGDRLAVKGVLVGGTDITVDEFTNGDYLDYRIKENTLGTYNVSYGDETGLSQLVSKAQRDLREHKESESRELMERFLSGLGSDGEPHVAYGTDEIDTAIEYGAVDTLLLSETLSEERVDDLTERARNIGSDVKLVPATFHEGQQLADVFAGVAAVLRYEI